VKQFGFVVIILSIGVFKTCSLDLETSVFAPYFQSLGVEP